MTQMKGNYMHSNHRKKKAQKIIVNRACHSGILVFLFLCLQNCISFSSYDKGRLIATSDSIAEIPVVIESGLLILEAEINGAKGRFLFDNGFSRSALDSAFAARNHIDFDSRSNLTDFNKRTVSAPKTAIDTTRIAHFLFVETDFHEISTAHIFPCLEVDGILGASIINKANWEIDFDARQIRLSSTPFQNKGIPLDISFQSNNSSETTLWLNGEHPIECKIDFGSNSALNLNYVDVISFLKGKPVEKRVGIKSISTHGPGPVSTFYNLATPLSVAHQGNDLLPTKATISHGLKYSGNIGTGLLKNYVVTINSAEERYLLSPPIKAESGKATDFRDYGITIYLHKGVWQIFHKNDVTPDFRNLAIGDTVVQIDHTPVEDFKSICDYREYLEAKKNAGEPLVLHIKGWNEPLTVPFRQGETIPLE